MDSVWQVVVAVNNHLEFQISYPLSVEEQEKIVAGFNKVNSIGFDVCAGAIDGILIWMQKPCFKEALRVGVGEKKISVDVNISLASIVKLLPMSMERYLTSASLMALRQLIVLPSRLVICMPNLKMDYYTMGTYFLVTMCIRIHLTWPPQFPMCRAIRTKRAKTITIPFIPSCA